MADIKYFPRFPKIKYDMVGDNKNFRLVTDITLRTRVRDVVKRQATIFYKYSLQDGDTADNLADKLYGSSNYFWLILFANDIVDPIYDWPLEQNAFVKFLQKKYNLQDISILQKANWTMDELAATNPPVVHHFEDIKTPPIDDDSKPIIIDYSTYKSMHEADDNSVQYVTYYDFEVGVNDSKRDIVLIKPEYAQYFDTQLTQLLK